MGGLLAHFSPGLVDMIGLACFSVCIWVRGGIFVVGFVVTNVGFLLFAMLGFSLFIHC